MRFGRKYGWNTISMEEHWIWNCIAIKNKCRRPFVTRMKEEKNALSKIISFRNNAIKIEIHQSHLFCRWYVKWWNISHTISSIVNVVVCLSISINLIITVYCVPSLIRKLKYNWTELEHLHGFNYKTKIIMKNKKTKKTKTLSQCKF